MWDMVELKKLGKVSTGSTPPSKKDGMFDGDIPFITPGDLESEQEAKRFVTEEGANHSRSLRSGATLVCCIGATIGKVDIARTQVTFNQQINGIEWNEKVDDLYGYYALRYSKPQIIGRAKSTTLPILKKSEFEKIQIPLPPLDVQKKIASVLEKADTLIAMREKQLAKLDELLQALFLDMFGDPVTNPKGWEKLPMGQLMTIVRGGSPRPINNFLGGNYPWIKIGDATKGDDLYLHSTKESIIEEGLTKTRLLPEGSLIFANCGVSLGFARIIKFEGCIHDGWLAFSEIDSRLNKVFLLKALNSVTDYFRKTAPDGTQPNLNTTIMKEFSIILPPIESQVQFEEIVLKTYAQRKQIEELYSKDKELFNSLTQRAFKGELELV